MTKLFLWSGCSWGLGFLVTREQGYLAIGPLRLGYVRLLPRDVVPRCSTLEEIA